jgi:hypothetical protein
MNKWPNKLDSCSKQEVQMANKCNNKWSTFLAINKMQIKTTLKFHFTLVRIAIIKSTTTDSGNNTGGKEPLYTVGGSVN